jgi:colanic acid biosynthesis glycosyl transferase WcaI
MRILVHDYGSYAFAFELAIGLAQRGHDVLHAISKAEPLRTSTQIPAALSNRLTHVSIDTGSPLPKTNFAKRQRWGRVYGKLVSQLAVRWKPDIVLSANTPLDAQRMLWGACSRLPCKKIFWLQDLLGVATRTILSKKNRALGRVVGGYYELIERRMLRNSDHVISIAEGFSKYLSQSRVKPEKISLIHNWAPIHELPVLPKSNSFALEFGIQESINFVYSGQLGLKHNPQLLIDLARYLLKYPEVRIVLCAIGPGFNFIQEQVQRQPLPNLIIVPLLEKDAGRFCVPSKILTYHCAGKPILFSAPADNLSSEIVANNGTGIVCDTEDRPSTFKAAERLLDAPLRTQMGRNGRAFAEAKFHFPKVLQNFESIFQTIALP